MRYKKISKEDVYRTLVSTSLEIHNPMMGAINLVNIANLLDTSRYQVKKHIDALKEEGMVELKYFLLYSEYDNLPPYWGYLLTEKGKSTKYYKEEEQRLIKSFEEAVKEFS